MNRLWLTDYQTKSLIRGLRNYIPELHRAMNEALDDKDLKLADYYCDEANILDTVLDSLEACYGD